MTTETLTPPVESTAAPATAGTTTNTFSVIGLVLSVLSIVVAMTPLAIVGIVFGFIGHRNEPAGRTMSIWAIVVGFVSLFGWLLVALAAAGIALPFFFGAWAFGWF
jgi:hypothetical protein